jgi:hypothetical protein
VAEWLLGVFEGEAAVSLRRITGLAEPEVRRLGELTVALLVVAQARHVLSLSGLRLLERALPDEAGEAIVEGVAGFVAGSDRRTGVSALARVLGRHFRPQIEAALALAVGAEPRAASRMLKTGAALLLAGVARLRRRQRLDIAGLASLVVTEAELLARRQPEVFGIVDDVLAASRPRSLSAGLPFQA